MLKKIESFVLANRESMDHHVNKIKEMEKPLNLIEIGMREYHIEPILSLTSLPESPSHYWRPSEVKRPFVLSPQTKFNGAFVKATIPLEEEDENRALIVWLYKEEILANLID